jgi:hypothetical protein
MVATTMAVPVFWKTSLLRFSIAASYFGEMTEAKSLTTPRGLGNLSWHNPGLTASTRRKGKRIRAALLLWFFMQNLVMYQKGSCLLKPFLNVRRKGSRSLVGIR